MQKGTVTYFKSSLQSVKSLRNKDKCFPLLIIFFYERNICRRPMDSHFQVFTSIMVTGIICLFVITTFKMTTLFQLCYWSSNSILQKQDVILELDPFDAYIRAHPVFGDMKFPRPQMKKKVNILLIASSGPKRSDRRQAIRDTWWKQCLITGKVITLPVEGAAVPANRPCQM